ncbi:hypothetical protein L195_g032071 [Trifolium pratense]|uniref:Uncharacterized protein n=1 Tax=Trifolium pratense TaxID=57577 RepID=A0A2K3LC66_TRIPR|nr:hypothetical protein L195_g032071 [Trifolium pratense]
MRTRLQHRQVHCPSIYPLCTEEEDDWHVLFTCDTSCSCWEQAGLTSFLQQRKQHFSSVIEVIMDICSVEEKSVAGHVAMVISGTFVTAATSWKANRVSVIEGEAAALPEAMQFARTSGRHNVIDAMSLNYAGVSEFSMLISSIKNLLNLCPNFENVATVSLSFSAFVTTLCTGLWKIPLLIICVTHSRSTGCVNPISYISWISYGVVVIGKSKDKFTIIM